MKIIEEIAAYICVNSHKVTLAKRFILNQQENILVSEKILNDFLKKENQELPKTIINHKDYPLKPQLQSLADYLSFKIAFCEAIYELININHFIPCGSFDSIKDHIQETTDVGNGGSTAGISLDEFVIPVPSKLIKPFSKRCQECLLYDSDMYCNEMKIENADKEVVLAIKESVKCFKHLLFQPAIMMLGRALEGAWIEMGLSLIRFYKCNLKSEDREKLENKLLGLDSFSWKVNEIVKLAEKKDVYKEIYDESCLSLMDIREAQIYTQIFLESRNIIHYGAKISLPNTYEKVSMLLIGATRYFPILYRIKKTIDDKKEI